MSNKTMNYGVAVTLKEQDAAAIAAGYPGKAANPLEALGAVAASLLQDLARGGVMLAPEWVSRVEAAIGTTSPEAIVQHVEMAVNRDGEAILIPWRVDPTQIAFYQGLADNAGISLERQLKAILDYAHYQGSFNQAAPEVNYLLLSPEQYRELQQRFGADIVTGEDVMRALRASAPESGEEDVILDSLTER